MTFGTDSQTFFDLNIFPQSRSEKSVFDWYNYTQTNGGKDLFLGIMKDPLSDLTAIKSRIDCVQFLVDNNLYCDLKRKDVDAVDYYLSEKNAILKKNILDSFYSFITYRLKPNNEYYQITRGLACLQTHIRSLIAFFGNQEIPDELPEFLSELKSEVRRIQFHPHFKPFINHKKKKLRFWQISRFDYLIRKKEKKIVEKLLELTYTFDCYLSLAEAAQKHKLGFPSFAETTLPELNIDGIFHPFIQNPVKNDIGLGQNQNLCFLSGANMAGKSTFLKSVGLCVYLSHIGFPVPAKAMQTSLFNGLYTTINISDDINKGYSYYYSEVKRVKDIVLQIKERKKVLVIFDELFRATLLITTGFTKIQQSVFFISTHIVEVGKELEMSDKVCFKCFNSLSDNGQPQYNYILNDGISSDRLGLTILKNEQIIEIIDEISENEKLS